MNDKKTEICISISSSPGTFGETVHNAGYKYHKLNYLYKAIKAKKIDKVISSIHTLDIKGCSVSMPFKEKIIKHLDKVDKLAKDTGAVNTVLKDQNLLIGYNTDVYGAYRAIKSLKVKKSNDVLILGAGGVARAIIVALKKIGIKNITIANRDLKRAKRICKSFKCNVIKWENRNLIKRDILINATSIGMKNNRLPIRKESIINFSKVMDVIVSLKDTPIIKEAKKQKIRNVSGLVMTFFQASSQYKIYTNKELPISIMLSAYNKKNKINIRLS